VLELGGIDFLGLDSSGAPCSEVAQVSGSSRHKNHLGLACGTCFAHDECPSMQRPGGRSWVLQRHS
jgi:hypothetical protein